MNKKLLLIAVAFSLTLTATAQDRFQLGVKTGFTSTQYTTDHVKSDIQWPDYQGIKEDAKAGYLLGAYMRIKLLGNLSIQPELYYAKKSGQAKYNFENDPTLTQNIDLYSWDIPVLARFDLIDLEAFKIFGITGPVASINAKNKTSLKSIGNDNVKNLNYAYQLGGGLEVWRLNLDARYEWGLSNVSEGLSNVDFERKSNMLKFSLSYRLVGF